MTFNLIAAAVPAFMLLIGVEYGVAKIRGKQLFRFHDAVTNISCGLGSEVSGIFLKGLGLWAYVWSYENFRVFTLSELPWVDWAVALLGVDFCYYWWHRASHRVHFIWAGHVVHHQSEDYNLAVALRQAWFTSLSSWVFYLPMAIIGVSPATYVTSVAISLLYQFWIHTELIGKLGPIEWIFNTPSHHRVHHSVNTSYIDKNYAAILIVWDRLFGTFEVESELPRYGTVTRHESWNPVWANFAHWAFLFGQARRARRWRDRIWIWFAPPEWWPGVEGEAIRGRPVEGIENEKWGEEVGWRAVFYVVFHFVPVAVGTTLLLWFKDDMSGTLASLSAALLIWTTLNWGAMFEGRRWAFISEWLRLGACIGSVVIIPNVPVWLLQVALLWVVPSAVWLVLARSRGWLAQGEDLQVA